MRKNRRKGFTIIELVIVITVIAILAGVLIPTFATLIKKAKMSADQRVVREMNLALQAEEIADQAQPDGVADALAILREAGFNVDNIVPSSTGYEFYWIREDNRVVLVEMNGTTAKAIVYPPELAEKYKDNLPQGDEWSKLGPEKSECTHDPDKYTYKCIAIALTTGGSDYHMVICTGCNTILAEDAPHVYQEDGTCSKCGYHKETSSEQECKHAYTTVGENKSYFSNGDGTHTKICLICNVAAKEDCEYDTEGVCVFCGYKQPTDGHKHDYSYTPNNDGTHSRTCKIADCPRQDEATATDLKCSYAYDGSVWKCIYCEAEAPASFQPKGGADGGIVDGFYYKNNRLFTGTVNGHDFEYGKLVVTDPDVPMNDPKYNSAIVNWTFNLPNENDYLTDHVVLRFEDKHSHYYGSLAVNNTINFVGGQGQYSAVKMQVKMSENILGAINFLERTIKEGNSKNALKMVETIYGFDGFYYPILTYSKDCEEYLKSLGITSKNFASDEQYEKYVTAAAEGNGYVDFLKKKYGKNGQPLEYFDEISWENYANIKNGQWDGGNNSGIIGGDPVTWESENNLYHADPDYVSVAEPEYVLKYWKEMNSNIYWFSVSDALEKHATTQQNIYEDAKGSNLNAGVYSHAEKNWKEITEQEYGVKIYSNLQMAEGIEYSSAKSTIYLISVMHTYFGGNIFQDTYEPSQTIEIMLEKTAA